MGILQIITIFVIFCAVWIITNFINQVMIGRMQQNLQRQRIDAAYAQVSRLVIRSIAEIRAKERIHND